MSKLLKTFKVIFCYKKFFSKFSRILILLPPSPCDYSCKHFEIPLREDERESETPGYEVVCINCHSQLSCILLSIIISILLSFSR